VSTALLDTSSRPQHHFNHTSIIPNPGHPAIPAPGQDAGYFAPPGGRLYPTSSSQGVGKADLDDRSAFRSQYVTLCIWGENDKAAREWALVLHARRGIAAKAQARKSGLSEKAIRHRLRAGKWRQVRRGVYATFTGELSREARLWAAIRRAGPGAMLSYETAAEVQGLADSASQPACWAGSGVCAGERWQRIGDSNP